MAQEENVLAGEQMTGARTKLTPRRETCRDYRGEKKERRKRDKTQENRTRGVDRNRASHLCYKAEQGTLPPDLPSSSYSRRQRYQVSVLSLSPPPPLRQQINEKTNKTTRSRGLYVATQTPLVGRTGTLLHDVTSLRHPLAVLLSHFAASICLHPRPLRACTKPQPGVSPPRRSPLVSDTW